MNQFVVDRIQTGGPGDLNIPTERIYETGNYQSVAIVRDVPDLSFNLDALDVDTEIEAILTGSADPSADAAGTKYSLELAQAMDIVSPWKSAVGSFDIVRSVAIPHLTLESASYRYGLRENAGATYTLRGDSVYYIPGQGYLAEYDGDGVTTDFDFNDDRDPTQPSALTALTYTEGGNTIYALNVSVDGVRQYAGEDYTETDSGISFTTAPENGALVRVVFGSTANTEYPQADNEGVATKAAAIRGKDIQVYLSYGVGPTRVRWSDVQSFNADFRLNLEDDFEFGNPRAVARDFTGAPEVSGSLELKPITAQEFFTKMSQITGVSASDIIGPQSSVPVAIEVQLLNPDSGGSEASSVGDVLKTLYIPDARFVLPGYEARANTKMVTTLNFESDSGTLEVFKGSKP